MENIRGIIFDYGGTLDSRGDHWFYIVSDAWAKAGVAAPDELLREVWVAVERRLAVERIILPEDNFLVLLRKKLSLQAELLAGKGVAVNSVQTEIAASMAYEVAYDCIVEAIPVLENLAAKYSLVLVSNFYGNIESVLVDFGIRRFFKGIIESAMVGVRKPDPRIFLMGCLSLGLNPDEVAVVGDTLSKDILPAESIGCKTFWLRGRQWNPTDDTMDHPSRIKSLSNLILNNL